MNRNFSFRKYNKIKSCFSVSAALFLGSLLTGCGMDTKEIGKIPALSPVQMDLGNNISSLVTSQSHEEGSEYSLYRSSANSFFKDPRAMHEGDILTVIISINDRANLNNRSDLKKDSDAKYKAGAGLSFLKSMDADVSGSTGAHSKGDAKIQRNEDIRLSVAAIVTKVLPNGNLLIQGSQEIRVNYELRVLNITGIVRPRDISGDNRIDYDKIAEARVSYGGRGRMSELQQTPYGQQFMNQVSPF